MTDVLTENRNGLALADEVSLTHLPPAHIRRAIRDAARVSLRRLARELGTTHASISYYERGGQPKFDMAIRYRRELERLAAITGFDMTASSENLTS